MNTSPKIQNLLIPYGKSLRLYVKSDTPARLRSAHVLGQQAVDTGVETLDLAWIHEQAMSAGKPPTVSPADPRAVHKRSRAFFSACNHVLETNSASSVAAHRSLEALKTSAGLCRKECGHAKRLLAKEIVRTKQLAEKLKISQDVESLEAKKLRTLQMQMSLLSRGILSAQEEERKRISRELHDVIAQLLTAINLRLTKMDIDITKDNRNIRKNIQSTQRLVEKSVAVVHRFARELRPAVLDDLGVIPALRSLVGDVSRESGVRVTLNVFAGIERLKSEKRTVLYRVAQEALINVHKYANASHVELSIRQHAGFVRMIIRDNGQGFDLEQAYTRKPSKQLGLLGMRERVEMVGGTFVVESAPNAGCTLQADIPFGPRKKASVTREK